MTRVLARTLRLQGTAAKSTVDRPWHRPCLGVSGTKRHSNRRLVRPIGPDLRQRMLGGRAFFGVAEGRTPRRDLDTWLRRRRRSDHWQPCGRRGYRELRQRGVGRQLAWHTVQSAHGPWRLRQSPALAIALPQRSFATPGLPSLSEDGPGTSSVAPPETCLVRPVVWEGGSREGPPYPD